MGWGLWYTLPKDEIMHHHVQVRENEPTEVLVWGRGAGAGNDQIDQQFSGPCWLASTRFQRRSAVGAGAAGERQCQETFARDGRAAPRRGRKAAPCRRHFFATGVSPCHVPPSVATVTVSLADHGPGRPGPQPCRPNFQSRRWRTPGSGRAGPRGRGVMCKAAVLVHMIGRRHVGGGAS